MLIVSHTGDAYNLDLDNLESLKIHHWGRRKIMGDGSEVIPESYEVIAIIKPEVKSRDDYFSLTETETQSEAEEYIKSLACQLNNFVKFKSVYS